MKAFLNDVLSALGWGPAGAPVASTPALGSFTGQRASAAPAAVVGATAAAAAPPDPTADAVLAFEEPPVSGAKLPGFNNGVTGVQVGHSRLEMPGAFIGDTVAADWYFPTQADGTVDAQGVIWLQHGFGATNTFYSALAQSLAMKTNSIVVAPTLSSIPFTFSGGCLVCEYLPGGRRRACSSRPSRTEAGRQRGRCRSTPAYADDCDGQVRAGRALGRWRVRHRDGLGLHQRRHRRQDAEPGRRA